MLIIRCASIYRHNLKWGCAEELMLSAKITEGVISLPGDFFTHTHLHLPLNTSERPWVCIKPAISKTSLLELIKLGRCGGGSDPTNWCRLGSIGAKFTITQDLEFNRSLTSAIVSDNWDWRHQWGLDWGTGRVCWRIELNSVSPYCQQCSICQITTCLSSDSSQPHNPITEKRRESLCCNNINASSAKAMIWFLPLLVWGPGWGGMTCGTHVICLIVINSIKDVRSCLWLTKQPYLLFQTKVELYLLFQTKVRF